MLGRLRNIIDELGAVNTLFYAASRALERTGRFAALYRYVLVAQPIAPAPLLPPGRARSLAVREVAPGDPALSAMPLDDDVLRFRFGQGAVCLGAFRESDMVACIWLQLGAFDEDEVRCRFVSLPAGRGSWDFDVYVLPGLRAGLAFARLWDAANEYLRDRGIAWSFSRISAFNPMSLASHRRLGARPIGTATYLRLGGWQLMAATLPPYLHLSTGPDRIPRVRLRPPKGKTAD